jgi:Trk-type K+ transport system membrane component
VAKQATELRYAVRFRVVLKYFGQLCLVLAVLTMAPLVMSLIFNERYITLRYAVVVCGLVGLGLGTARLRAPSNVQANEAMVLVALMFLFTPLAMCYPMMSSGLSFLDALFEAISGVTTTGGFKLLRLLIAASVFRLILLRTCLPKHAVIEPRLAGRRLQDEEIRAALLLIVLFVVVALSWLPFVAMGYSPLDSLFEVVSATGTAGLSVGLTSGTLPALLKGILCVDMLMGRLEIIAWLVMLYPGTWFGRRMEGT